jgi:transposase InsO family protein
LRDLLQDAIEQAHGRGYPAGRSVRGIEEVEFATLEWVDWSNDRRLLGPIGRISPAEFEAVY